MSAILDRAKAHFEARLSGEPSRIEVPEWGENGQPLVIYYKPMTLKAKSALSVFADNPFEYAVESLIRRALDADGKPIFRPVEKVEIMRHVDPDVVERIVISMVGDDKEDLEGIEKN